MRVNRLQHMGKNSFVPEEELALLSQEDKRQTDVGNRRKKMSFLTDYPLSQVRGQSHLLRVSGDHVVRGVRRGETIGKRFCEEQESEST